MLYQLSYFGFFRFASAKVRLFSYAPNFSPLFLLFPAFSGGFWRAACRNRQVDRLRLQACERAARGTRKRSVDKACRGETVGGEPPGSRGKGPHGIVYSSFASKKRTVPNLKGSKRSRCGLKAQQAHSPGHRPGWVEAMKCALQGQKHGYETLVF